MVLGIIGGVSSLMAGFFLVVLGTAILLSSETALIYKITYSGLIVLLAIAPPIISVIGAGIVRNKPLLGSSLMALGSVAIIFCGYCCYFCVSSSLRLCSHPLSSVFYDWSSSRGNREISNLNL